MNVQRSLEDTQRLYPQAWAHAHRDGDPARWDFIILAVRRLWAESAGTVGGNWRRGVHGDLSMDGLSVLGGDGQWRFADIIVGAGGDNPRLSYHEPSGDDSLLRNSAGHYVGIDGVAKPENLPATHLTYDAPSGPSGGNNNSGSGLPVTTTCNFQQPDFGGLIAAIMALSQELVSVKADAKQAASAALDARNDVAFLREQLAHGAPVTFPAYGGSIRIFGTSVPVELKPKS
jgi:hypothetical protein